MFQFSIVGMLVKKSSMLLNFTLESFTHFPRNFDVPFNIQGGGQNCNGILVRSVWSMQQVNNGRSICSKVNFCFQVTFGKFKGKVSL
jgi:hypothetical protein